MKRINRREALGTLGVLSAAGALGGVTGQAAGQPARGRGREGMEYAGPPGRPAFNPSSGEYILPELPYAYDALEPHIDAQTMQIHHQRHHQGYVNGLNTATAKLREIRSGQGDPAVLEHWQRELSFNAGGHVNHTLFWGNMAPEAQGGGGQPAGPLADAIARDFGGFEQFATYFRNTAAAVEASGWGWLAYEPISRTLTVLQMHSQQHSLINGAVPLLGVDVWEHAYYLKYQNKRADYLAAFMNVVNWPEVQRRYDAAARA